jgi:ABC-type tungstate transport system permease subunit
VANFWMIHSMVLACATLACDNVRDSLRTVAKRRTSMQNNTESGTKQGERKIWRFQNGFQS